MVYSGLSRLLKRGVVQEETSKMYCTGNAHIYINTQLSVATVNIQRDGLITEGFHSTVSVISTKATVSYFERPGKVW